MVSPPVRTPILGDVGLPRGGIVPARASQRHRGTLTSTTGRQLLAALSESLKIDSPYLVDVEDRYPQPPEPDVHVPREVVPERPSVGHSAGLTVHVGNPLPVGQRRPQIAIDDASEDASGKGADDDRRAYRRRLGVDDGHRPSVFVD